MLCEWWMELSGGLCVRTLLKCVKLLPSGSDR